MKYLFSIILLISSVCACAQLTYEILYVDYDSAWQYKNLKIIPIRPKAGFGINFKNEVPGNISLSQGIKNGSVIVTERGSASTENVHYLRINNNSDKNVYIASGEIIAGGRQDRIIARDTILLPSSKDQYVPVMCVEENRWSDKEKKFVYSNFANQRLRKILDLNKNQVLIWKEIDSQLAGVANKHNTMAYLSRTLDKKGLPDKKITMENEAYFNYFLDKFKRSDSSIVGFVCLSDNRVIGSDIFAGTNLFYDQLEPLLRGYIDEAVLFGLPVTFPDKEVKKYMDKLLSDEKSQEEFVKKNGKIFRQDGHIFHINTF